MKTTIKFKMRTPVSHIGENASTGSYFQTILSSTGRIPVITGNSIRGQIRDAVASRLLEILDTRVSKEVFNVLFSGGNLNGTMKDDVGRAKQIRAHFPSVSLLGGGLGSMIMSGKMLVGFGYPICTETEEITGIPGEVSWHSLIDEIEFTRTDDSKNDTKADAVSDIEAESKAKASTQMRYSVQYMAAGTEFITEICFLEGTTALELGAFYSGLLKWFETPRIGGMSAKGFGMFDAVVGNGDIVVVNGDISVNSLTEAYVADYEKFIAYEGDRFLSLLEAKEAKGVKKANVTD